MHDLITQIYNATLSSTQPIDIDNSNDNAAPSKFLNRATNVKMTFLEKISVRYYHLPSPITTIQIMTINKSN